jgi:hypothetical protein
VYDNPFAGLSLATLFCSLSSDAVSAFTVDFHSAQEDELPKIPSSANAVETEIDRSKVLKNEIIFFILDS